MVIVLHLPKAIIDLCKPTKSIQKFINALIESASLLTGMCNLSYTTANLKIRTYLGLNIMRFMWNLIDPPTLKAHLWCLGDLSDWLFLHIRTHQIIQNLLGLQYAICN